MSLTCFLSGSALQHRCDVAEFPGLQGAVRPVPHRPRLPAQIHLQESRATSNTAVTAQPAGAPRLGGLVLRAGAWGSGSALQKGNYRKGTTESWGALPPVSWLCCELDALEGLSAEQLLLLHLPLLGGWQQSSLLLPLAASTQPRYLPGKQKPQHPPERRTTESHCCVVFFPREFLGVSEHEHHH